MDTATPDTQSIEDMLTELASLGMRAVRVVTRMMEIEQQAADLVASWLPEHGTPQSYTEATTAGLSVDQINDALKQAVPRVEALAKARDKLDRSVRYTAALLQRIRAGWTGTTRDDRTAMTRRQVARGVSEAIRRHSEGERAERLFDELAVRLEDPELDTEIATLPAEEVVRRICRDLGLAASGLAAAFCVQPEGLAGTDTG